MITFALILAILLFPYFAPAIITLMRSHHQRWAILAPNLFLGWTFLGWVAALIWSLTKADVVDGRHQLKETFR